MNILLFMIPLALFLGGLGLAAFLWALKSGQYEDLDGAAQRILMDDDLGEVGPEKRRFAAPRPAAAASRDARP